MMYCKFAYNFFTIHRAHQLENDLLELAHLKHGFHLKHELIYHKKYKEWYLAWQETRNTVHFNKKRCVRWKCTVRPDHRIMGYEQQFLILYNVMNMFYAVDFGVKKIRAAGEAT